MSLVDQQGDALPIPHPHPPQTLRVTSGVERSIARMDRFGFLDTMEAGEIAEVVARLEQIKTRECQCQNRCSIHVKRLLWAVEDLLEQELLRRLPS